MLLLSPPPFVLSVCTHICMCVFALSTFSWWFDVEASWQLQKLLIGGDELSLVEPDASAWSQLGRLQWCQLSFHTVMQRNETLLFDSAAVAVIMHVLESSMCIALWWFTALINITTCIHIIPLLRTEAQLGVCGAATDFGPNENTFVEPFNRLI